MESFGLTFNELPLVEFQPMQQLFEHFLCCLLFID